MKEFIDKLISRLKAEIDKECVSSVPKIRLCDAISIVNQLAEEYNNKSVKGDLISRSVAKTKMAEWLRNWLGEKDKRSLEQALDELPTACNDGWIPCSERLPSRSEVWIGKDITDEEPREFIVMVKGAYYPTTGYYTDDGWVKDIYNKENGSGYGNEIIAWRFFPAPYQQKGE